MKLYAVLFVLSTVLTFGRACCPFNGKCYPNGHTIPGICLILRCQSIASSSPRWILQGIISKCGKCLVSNFLPLFKTFDNIFYGFDGVCNYTLTQYLNRPPPFVHDPKHGIFENFVRCAPNRHCFGETTYKADWNTAVTVNHNVLTTLFTIFVNNVPKTLTSTLKTLAPYPVIAGIAGPLTLIQGPVLSLVISPWLIAIWAPGSMLNNEVGLCGLYNNRFYDDLTMRNGRVTSNITDFADSWLTNNEEHDFCHDRRRPAMSSLSSSAKNQNRCDASAEDIELCEEALKPYEQGQEALFQSGTCKQMLCSGGEQKKEVVIESISEITEPELEVNGEVLVGRDAVAS